MSLKVSTADGGKLESEGKALAFSELEKEDVDDESVSVSSVFAYRFSWIDTCIHYEYINKKAKS